MLGAIEAGGTKFVCAVSNDALKIKEKITIPTTTPSETLQEVFNFFDSYDLKAIGIGSFGPIDINKESDKYGYITSTPKLKWRNTNMVSIFKERYQVPIGWDTDVNAAALGEAELGGGKNKNSTVYITVGTGIGGGAVYNGEILSGYSHPEMGHIYIPRHEQDVFEGSCNYHVDCLEGLAAGSSLEKRYGKRAEELPEDHEAWEIEAHYLAHAAIIYTMTLRPDCIIFGGGVMQQKHLFPLIRKKFAALLKDYLDVVPLDEYIIPTGLGSESGILGSILLAKNALKENNV